LNDRGVPAVSLGMQNNNTLPRTRRSLAVVIGVALALALMLGACSSSSKSGSPSSSSTTGVTIKDLAFTTTPVKAGATVTVANNDTVMHTVTSDDGTFDVSIDPGKSATFTAPSKAGSYKFHCKIHSSMHGTLTVQ
jgi:plastocyanin